MITEAGMIASAVGLAVVAQVDPITTGQQLGKASASVVLGIVCVSCVVAMYRLYKDKQEQERSHNQALYNLIASSTQNMQSNADSNREVAAILVELKTEMLKCHSLRKHHV